MFTETSKQAKKFLKFYNFQQIAHCSIKSFLEIVLKWKIKSSLLNKNYGYFYNSKCLKLEIIKHLKKKKNLFQDAQ